MKKTNFLKPLAVTILTVLPALGNASLSAQENCDVVHRAAIAGRDLANQRIGAAEAAVREAAERHRSCLEQFADLASRQSISIGGFDASALRDFLGQQACNMIETGASRINASTAELQRIQTAGQQVLSGASVATNPIVPQATSTQGRSIWTRMSCSFSGNC